MAFKLYHYDPSFVAAAIFIALFALSALVHIFQLARARTWYMIPFVIGCLCKFNPTSYPRSTTDSHTVEAFGYLGRAISSKQTPDWTTMPYVMQSLLLLLGPTLLAASIYMVLGRLIRLVGGEKYSLIRVQWLTKVFVLGDVISFLGQSGGKRPSTGRTNSN